MKRWERHHPTFLQTLRRLELFTMTAKERTGPLNVNRVSLSRRVHDAFGTSRDDLAIVWGESSRQHSAFEEVRMSS